VVIQFVNFPYPSTVPVVTNALNKGVGFGSPDVFLADEDHDQYVYPFADQAQGKVPIGMQVESDCYYTRSVGGPFDPPPVHQIYVFARDRLHSNYIFWERDLRDPPFRAWEDVLQMFHSPDFPASPSGGLQTRCPGRFGGRCFSQSP
jgi:hypothetical protein